MTPLYIYLGILLLLAVLAGSYTLMAIWTKRMMRSALRREVRAQQDREEVVSFLNRFCVSMVTNQDRDAWRREVAGYLREVLSAQAMHVYLVAGNQLELVCREGELPVVRGDSISHGDRQLEILHNDVIAVGDGPVGEVALTMRSSVLNLNPDRAPVTGDPQSLGSLLAAPMLINDQLVGIVVAVNRRRHGSGFSNDDRILLEALAMQVALGETLIVALDELGTQERIRQELSLARRIQDSLLPPAAPASEHIQIHAEGASAREVGGDFYDFVELDEDLLLVVIADASGKGVPACMLMAMCRSFMRSNAARFRHDLEGLLGELNRSLFDDTDAAQFVTLACCLIDRRDFTVEYARAGHTELMLKLPDGRVRSVEPEGPALGLLNAEFGISFDTFSFNWRPGMSIMMFTDGITEALNPKDEEFGSEALVSSWERQPLAPQAAISGILTDVEAFQSGRDAEDDQTVVILTRNLGSS
jgi:sigma-B regulation protein RsbU (phosphoserine phosphatase)